MVRVVKVMVWFDVSVLNIHRVLSGCEWLRVSKLYYDFTHYTILTFLFPVCATNVFIVVVGSVAVQYHLTFAYCDCYPGVASNDRST